MSFSESFSSLLGKKDKAKTPPAKAEVAPSAEAEKAPTDRELIAEGLARVEIMFANAEKYKKESRGMTHLAGVEIMLDIIEAAKAGDPAALEKLRRAYLTPEGRVLLDIITATTPEGKEITMDLSQILQKSKDKFTEYNLPEFAAALPDEAALSESALALCREAIEQGFTEAVYVPDLETQDKVGIAGLKTKLADKPLPKGAFTDEKDNYPNESHLETPIAEKHFLTDSSKAKRQNGYLLFYSPGPIPEKTKNMSFTEAEVYFKKRNWDGLTLPDYYIIQRIEAENNRDHSFDVYDDDPKKSNAEWLVASRAPNGCVYAGWDQFHRQVEVSWNDADLRDPWLGARPVIVVPLLYSEARPPAETKEKSARRDPEEFLTSVFDYIDSVSPGRLPEDREGWAWAIDKAGIVDMGYSAKKISPLYLDKTEAISFGESVKEGMGFKKLVAELKGKRIQSVASADDSWWYLKTV